MNKNRELASEYEDSKRYQVRAIYQDESKPFAELVGTYYSQQQAEDAKEAFEDQEDAPNFMACEIVFLVEPRE
jgi:hypothetical protein